MSDDREWAFVEGTGTGVPMNQLTVVVPKMDAKATSQNAPPANPFGSGQYPPAESTASKPGMAEEKTTLDDGAVVLIDPDNLGADSVAEFEYWIEGVVRRLRRKANLPPANEVAQSPFRVTGRHFVTLAHCMAKSGCPHVEMKRGHTSTACSCNSSSDANSRADMWVAARMTGGAMPAS